MNNTYLIRLRPQTHYYFGGEKGLGGGDTRNYLVHSRQWPQQTALLGMIRYLILQENHMLASKGQKVPPEAKTLIGPRSFNLGATPGELEDTADFGMIQGLSPLFLLKDGQPWFRIIMDQEKHLEMAEKAGIWYGGEYGGFQQAFLLNGFEAKDGLGSHLVGLSGEKSGYLDITKEEDSPFESAGQVGIEKGDEGKTKEQAFYKQTFYRLRKGWEFGFLLTVSENPDAIGIPENALVPFGGERKLFHWKKEEVPETWPELESSPDSGTGINDSRLVLLSDALVPEHIQDLCHFAITDTVDFRFLHTKVDTTEAYAEMSRKEGPLRTPQKSAKYNLLKAGSMLYPKDRKEVKNLLKKPRLRQIGYNYFTYLPA